MSHSTTQPAKTPRVEAQASTPELLAYYANRPLLWRNVGYLMSCRVGWDFVFAIVAPLMLLRLAEVGVSTGTIGLITSINSWAVAFLVMYFSWRSDHTISRFGRRLPYLLISGPFIIVTMALFPFFDVAISLILLTIVKILFMDLKNSTFALLPIDLVPRAELGRFQALYHIVAGLTAFIALQWGFRSVNITPWFPYVVGAALMTITTATGMLIREPPIQSPTTENWKPWSALVVGWQDRRMIVLMTGVSLVGSFAAIYATWLWLFAAKQLGFTAQEIGPTLAPAALIGVAAAWPVGWVLDRIGGLKVTIVYIALLLIPFYFTMTAHTKSDIVWLAIMAHVAGCLASAAGMMILKIVPAKDVGSVTSSTSFIRNLYNGFLIGVSGYMIQWLDGNYRPVFVVGMVMSLLGMVLLFVYRDMMQRDVVAEGPAEVADTAGGAQILNAATSIPVRPSPTV